MFVLLFRKSVSEVLFLDQFVEWWTVRHFGTVDSGSRAASATMINSGSIGVYARVRPEASRRPVADLSVLSPQNILVRNLEFSLDHVFDVDATQETVYDVVGRQRVARVPEGFNVCIVAYGQTGSGKTHTMFGPDEVLADGRAAPAEQHGLALRAMAELFEATSAIAEPSVTCSYVEVYNDQCNDLLGRKRALPLREGPDRAPSLEGLCEEPVSDLDAAMEALARGSRSRTVAAMRMNARSSRSHAVFSLTLRGAQAGGGTATTTGKLVLVDLAGMESSKKSYAVEGASANGARREEAKQINTSLYALGTVIERLSAAAREQHVRPGASGRGGGSGGGGNGEVHVPFRNSKLTRLLQECLHGNTAAAFIVTLRGEAENLDECAATLRFAQRARAVPVRVRPNIQAAPADPSQLKAELKAVTRELAQAKAQIDRLQHEVYQSTDAARPPTALGLATSSAARGGMRAAGDTGVGTRDEEDEAMETRRSELLAGRLAVGQLSEQMAALLEQTREAAAGGDSRPTARPPAAPADPSPPRPVHPFSWLTGEAPAPESAPLADLEAHARAEAAEEAAREAKEAASVAVEEAQRAAAAAKAEAAEAVRTHSQMSLTFLICTPPHVALPECVWQVRVERARAAKQVRSAQASAVVEKEAREAERAALREAAAHEAARRGQAASKAEAGRAKAEQAARVAEARAEVAEQQAAREKERADVAERARAQPVGNSRAARRATSQAGAPVAAESSAAGALLRSADPFPSAAGATSPDPSPPGSSAATSLAQKRLQRSAARCTPNGTPRSSPPSSHSVPRGETPTPPTPAGSELAQLHALAQFGSAQLDDMNAALHSMDPASGWTPPPQMYELVVPDGVVPGGTFQAVLGDTVMLVNCPLCCYPGDRIRVEGPRRTSPQSPQMTQYAPTQAPYPHAQYPGAARAHAPPAPMGDMTPRTASVIAASAKEATAMETLGSLFPALPRSELRAVLERWLWDVNQAACELMDVGLR